MRTARSSSRPRGVSTRYPPGANPPGPGAPRTRRPPGPGTHPWKQTPTGLGTPPLDRITDACENITFPQLRCGR